jgi:hypothetical protein
MLLADVLINALNPAFEDREKAFNCIGVCVTTDIFTFTMTDDFMPCLVTA